MIFEYDVCEINLNVLREQKKSTPFQIDHPIQTISIELYLYYPTHQFLIGDLNFPIKKIGKNGRIVHCEDCEPY